MPESFSLNDLFAKGLTKEQFIEKYTLIKSSGAAQNSSIFNDGMEGIIAEMFDTLDTDKSGTLDKSEIKDLKAMSETGSKSKLTEDDIIELYKKTAENIMQKYSSETSVADMYNNALQETSGNPAESHYIEDLDNDSNALIELINNVQNNSTTLINDYRTQINNLLQESHKLDNDTKDELKKATDDAKQSSKELAEKKAELLKLEQENRNKTNLISLLQRSIQELDPENDKDEIQAKSAELTDLQSAIDANNTKIETLNSDISSCEKNIKIFKNLVSEIQTKTLNGNSRLSNRIGQLQALIDAEEKNTATLLQTYQSRLDLINNAKNYACSKIDVKPSAETFASAQNDGGLSLAELQAKGLTYNAELGQNLANYVGQRATGFIGRCSNRVVNGLSAMSRIHPDLAKFNFETIRQPSACMVDDAFRKNIANGNMTEFMEIKVNSLEDLKKLPAGCVVVYEANAAWDNGFKTGHYNAKHGHIEVTLGDGRAASDGITNNLRYSKQMSVFVPVKKAQA